MDHNDIILKAYEEQETFDHTTIGLWTTEPKKRDLGKETLDQNSLDPRPPDPF